MLEFRRHYFFLMKYDDRRSLLCFKFDKQKNKNEFEGVPKTRFISLFNEVKLKFRTISAKLTSKFI